MLAHQQPALCQAITLNLLSSDKNITRLKPGDILEIDCDGHIMIKRNDQALHFDLNIEKETEREFYYMGCRLDTQMVGIVKLISALLGVKLMVLKAEKRQCRFLVNARD